MPYANNDGVRIYHEVEAEGSRSQILMGGCR